MVIQIKAPRMKGSSRLIRFACERLRVPFWQIEYWITGPEAQAILGKYSKEGILVLATKSPLLHGILYDHELYLHPDSFIAYSTKRLSDLIKKEVPV